MATNHPHVSPTAVAYARSLLELATERNQAEPIGQEMRDIKRILDENPVFRAFLADPGISETERGEALKRIFEGKAAPLVMPFLSVLNIKGRMRLLQEIAEAYDNLLDEQLGKVEVDVIVAQKLDAAQLEQVRAKVSAALKKDAVVHQYVDESIIGGIVLRVQDKLIDGSVKYQLNSLRQQLLAARPK